MKELKKYCMAMLVAVMGILAMTSCGDDDDDATTYKYVVEAGEIAIPGADTLTIATANQLNQSLVASLNKELSTQTFSTTEVLALVKFEAAVSAVKAVLDKSVKAGNYNFLGDNGYTKLTINLVTSQGKTVATKTFVITKSKVNVI